MKALRFTLVLDNKMTDPQDMMNETAANRRKVLMLGAVGASAMLTVRPALAQTVGSAINCQIPVPDAARAGQAIAADGTMVPVGTAGSIPAPNAVYTGEQVKRALAGNSLPGADYTSTQAYLNYIRRLQTGQSGFTCFASLQMR